MDTEWFKARIRERYGSQRDFAQHFQGSDGKALNQSNVSRMLNGERRMVIEEARQLAELLDVSVVEVLIRAGAMTESDVKAWIQGNSPKRR